MENLWITREEKVKSPQPHLTPNSYAQSYAPVFIFKNKYLGTLCNTIHAYIYIKQQLFNIYIPVKNGIIRLN